MSSTEDLSHLTSLTFVQGRPPEEQNKFLQQFIQPHIQSFNFMADEGLKIAAQVNTLAGHSSKPVQAGSNK